MEKKLLLVKVNRLCSWNCVIKLCVVVVCYLCVRGSDLRQLRQLLSQSKGFSLEHRFDAEPFFLSFRL